jgi:hypothetical protein
MILDVDKLSISLSNYQNLKIDGNSVKKTQQYNIYYEYVRQKIMPWVQELIEIIKRQRKHASFFEWPQKDIKELGILKCLIESLEKSGYSFYSDPHRNIKDPPDCIARDNSGKLVGVEISELVNLNTVRDTQHNNDHPKYWDSQEVIDEIHTIIQKKDNKKFHGGPYSSIILIIFTDEPFLDPDEVIPKLKQHEFKKTNQIDEIYLLFSYDPRYHMCPYLKLNKSDNIQGQGEAPGRRPLS